MDKMGVLIERLLEQYRNNASKEQLRVTAQLLLAELDNKNGQREPGNSSIISVIYPSSTNVIRENEEINEPVVLPVKEEKKPAIVAALPETEMETDVKPGDEKQAYNFFDPMIDIPTLALKQQEVNETITRQESLNDKFKLSSPNKEVSHNISNVPIKDLRKAIGINDQYLFINELFRGDQTMYDRSIKTINSFNIYGEAELWIKRELKLKLGWNEDSSASVLFDQLVRRRFS